MEKVMGIVLGTVIIIMIIICLMCIHDVLCDRD